MGTTILDRPVRPRQGGQMSNHHSHFWHSKGKEQDIIQMVVVGPIIGLLAILEHTSMYGTSLVNDYLGLMVI